MKDYKGAHSEIQFQNGSKFPQNLKKIAIPQNKLKRKSFNKGIYNININNFNINTRGNFTRNFSSKTLKIMRDFKKALEKTELIRKTLFNDKRFFTSSNTNNNNDKIKSELKTKDNLYIKNDIMNKFKPYLSPININKEIKVNSYRDFSSFNDLDKYRNYKTPTINRNISYITSSKNNFNENLEENNTNFKNENLKKEGDFLVNENALLSSRLKECKSKLQKTKSYNKNSPINYFDENRKKFINSLKSSLNYNLNNNLEIAKDIIKTLKEIKTLKKDFEFKFRREKNENFISIKIVENNKKYNKLKEENALLIKEFEKLKINMSQLKSIEKILSLKYEFEHKTEQDKIEQISKLKFTIIKLNKTHQNLYKNRLTPAKNLKLNNINRDNKKINELNQINLIFKFLSNQKNILMNLNKKIKIDNDKMTINFDKNKIKELKENLASISKDNLETKLKLEKKEKQIIILRDIINKFTKAINQNNMKDEIFKLNLDKLTREDYDDTEYKNLLIKNKIKNSINERNYFQIKKNKKQVNIIKTYEKILNEKDIEISNLEDKIEYKNSILGIIEDKVKPLYKKNNNVLSKSNSLKYSKSYNNIIDINSKENIDKTNKQENLFDKLRKRKNKNL